MRAGELNRRVNLERVTLTTDEGGGKVETWTPYATIWAGIKALSAREQYTAQQLEASITHRITLRWRDDVQPRDRVRYNSRVFEIDAATSPLEGRESLVLTCVEQPALEVNR